MVLNYGKCTKKCGRCKYSIKMGTVTTCNYILVTGRMRGCEIENCTKYEGKAKKSA